MKQDRFLFGILVGIGLLVLISLALFFNREKNRTFLEENSPEAIVLNYVLALENQDFRRAYGYLADQKGKPSYDTFRQAFTYNMRENGGAGLRILETSLENDSAYLAVSIYYAARGPFNEVAGQNGEARLVLQNGFWKITMLPYPYFQWDWYQTEVKAEPLPAP